MPAARTSSPAPMAAGLLAMAATLAIVVADTGVAAPADGGRAGTAALAGPADATVRTAQVWLADAWQRAPALVLGLGVALAVPVLALLGVVLRSLGRRAGAAAAGDPATSRTVRDHLSWPAVGWVTVEGGEGGARRRVPREIMRIGRESDNELVLPHATVHRYHAVIQRTPESDFIIVDISGAEGNGIKVNGERRPHARLKSGDVIDVGAVRLSFSAEPA